jgi:hypothetical protein
MARSRWRWCPGARASSFTRAAAFLKRHAPSSTMWVPTETRNPPSSQTRTDSARPTRASRGPSSTLPARCGGINHQPFLGVHPAVPVSLASLKIDAAVGPRQEFGFEAPSGHQGWGSKNPRNLQIRWYLGTAIKSRQRAAPYPASRRQKYAAPKKAKEGLHQKKEEKQMN